jgi:fibronectin type 3 domain-containing protein
MKPVPFLTLLLLVLAGGALDARAADGCAPTSFAADPLGGVVHLHWDDTAGAEGYNIYRAEGDGPFMLAILMQAPSNETIDTQVESGLTYRYMATAVVAGAETPACNVATVTVGGECAPTLTVDRFPGHNELTWTFNRVADSYNVYRATGHSHHFKLIGNVVNDNHYTDTDLSPRKEYRYQVRAIVHGDVERPACNTA